MFRRILISFLAVIFIGGGIAFALLAVRAQSGLDKGERLMKRGMFPGARVQLDRYLWLHPRDGKARLLMAEALVRDESLPARESAPLAIAHLQRIPDRSPHAAHARIQEARQQLLILHKAAAAEKLLREAIRLDPQNFDAHYVLWKLTDLIGRSHLAEPIFWKVYALAPEDAQAEILREWYVSQFFPQRASVQMDGMLGFLEQSQVTGNSVEPLRYLRFRETEPASPLGHAALARWFLFEGKPKRALEILDHAAAQIENEKEDLIFVSTQVRALIELGEFQRAAACFAQWPTPHAGHEYWMTQAIVLDEVEEDYRQAISAYQRALSTWPGPVDWRTRHRIANCLARLGKPEQAIAARAEAERVEKLMQAKAHQPVREALQQLDNAEKLKYIAAFYQTLNCPRHAASWQEQIDRLTKTRGNSARPSKDAK